MEENEKEFVRDYNATIKHGDPIEKISMPPGISVKTRARRTQITEGIKLTLEQKTKGKERKKKGVTFGISDADHVENDDE